MRTPTLSSAFLLLSSLALLTQANKADSHSSEDAHLKDVKFVLQVSTPGASTPAQNFYRAKDIKDEPKIDNFLTPLGQRQQFLIGTELRNRYVNEAKQFLNKSFDISQVWIQSTFDQKSILSAQAQLLGIYPPYTSDNYLNTWQQENAIPPLINSVQQEWDPYFKQWQQELGSKALLDNINTFPINMVGHDDDLMLRLNSKNCEAWNQSAYANFDILVDQLEHFDHFFSRLSKLFGVADVNYLEATEMCQYLQWADLHNVELSIDFEQNDLNECSHLDTVLIKYDQYIDQQLNLLSSIEFLQYLHDHIQTISGTIEYTSSSHFKKYQLKHILNKRPEYLQATNAAAQPNYVFLMTEPNNLKLFLAALTPASLKESSTHHTSSSVPSSTLIFQIIEDDKSGQLYVEALFNDERIELGGCSQNGEKCSVANFTQWLGDNIKITDVVGACAGAAASIEKKNEFIQ